MSIWKWDKAGLFVGGMLFATKGIELLKSKELHDVYVKTTAAALRGRDEVMENVTALREGCEDIYAEAVDYNEKKAEDKLAESKVLVIEDASASKAAKAPARKTAAKKTTAKKTAKK